MSVYLSFVAVLTSRSPPAPLPLPSRSPLPCSEIPGFRLDYSAVHWEINLMKDLGVKVVTGKELGKDFTVDSLRDKGEAKAVLGESLLYVLVG